MTVADRTFILLRHSKAEHGGGTPDIERPLSPRGQRDAEAVGQWFADQDLVADLVVCSPSVRTRQTWETAAEAGAEADDIWYDRRVYDASADELLDVVREVPEDATVVVLVGHAPGIPSLVGDLAVSGGGSERAWARLDDGLPTSGIAVLSFTGSWAELGPEDAVLEDVVAPRG
ncbi:MAG: SixA phosphatase family protein [Oryzihumus sp.]